MKPKQTFKCEECGQVFETYKEYVEHMRAKHWDAEDEEAYYSEEEA